MSTSDPILCPSSPGLPGLAVEGASGAGGEAGVFRVAHEGVGLGACEGEMSAVQCIGAESVEDRVGPGRVVFVLPRGDQQAVAAAVVD